MNTIFLVVQHSDNILRELYLKKKKLSQEDREYLYVKDKILVKKNEPQLYGTQYEYKDGKLQPSPYKSRFKFRQSNKNQSWAVTSKSSKYYTPYEKKIKSQWQTL